MEFMEGASLLGQVQGTANGDILDPEGLSHTPCECAPGRGSGRTRPPIVLAGDLTQRPPCERCQASSHPDGSAQAWAELRRVSNRREELPAERKLPPCWRTGLTLSSVYPSARENSCLDSSLSDLIGQMKSTSIPSFTEAQRCPTAGPQPPHSCLRAGPPSTPVWCV